MYFKTELGILIATVAIRVVGEVTGGNAAVEVNYCFRFLTWLLLGLLLVETLVRYRNKKLSLQPATTGPAPIGATQAPAPHVDIDAILTEAKAQPIYPPGPVPRAPTFTHSPDQTTYQQEINAALAAMRKDA